MGNQKKKPPEVDPMEVTVHGFEAIEKTVKPGGNSGRVYVPTAWVSCRVKIIRLDPLPET
jgi:putative transposon-encoded protein